jgi:predicted nucleic acid-binding Zn ribbon protein
MSNLVPSAPEQRPQNVITLLPGVLVACPGCGKAFAPRRPNHRYCSATCRVVWFQQKQEKARRERDAKVRLLLKEALELLEDNGGHGNGRTV